MKTVVLSGRDYPARMIVGCIKLLQDRGFFIRGLDHAVNTLHPKTIIVYGTAPDAVFGKYKNAGIKVLQFDSDYMIAHQKEVSE